MQLNDEMELIVYTMHHARQVGRENDTILSSVLIEVGW